MHPHIGPLAERFFVIGCSLWAAVGLVATAGMLLAAAAFTTARTFVVPLVATFEGFHDIGGANAVTVTGSWAMAGAVTIIVASVLSFLIIRRFGSSTDSTRRA